MSKFLDLLNSPLPSLFNESDDFSDEDEKAMLRLGLRTCMNYTAEAMCNEFKPDTQIYTDYKEHHYNLYELIEKLK